MIRDWWKKKLVMRRTKEASRQLWWGVPTLSLAHFQASPPGDWGHSLDKLGWSAGLGEKENREADSGRVRVGTWLPLLCFNDLIVGIMATITLVI